MTRSQMENRLAKLEARSRSHRPCASSGRAKLEAYVSRLAERANPTPEEVDAARRWSIDEYVAYLRGQGYRLDGFGEGGST